MRKRGERKRRKRRTERRRREKKQGLEEEEEVTKQEKCVEAKKEANSKHKENDVSNRHMTWWKSAWWIRVDRDDDRVEETQSFAEEAEEEKWRRKERRERQNKQCSENTLLIVLHFPNNANETATTGASTRSNAIIMILSSLAVESLWRVQ